MGQGINHVVHKRGRQLGSAQIGEFELARISFNFRYEKLKDLLRDRARTGGTDGAKLRKYFNAIVQRAAARDFEFIGDRDEIISRHRPLLNDLNTLLGSAGNRGPDQFGRNLLRLNEDPSFGEIGRRP